MEIYARIRRHSYSVFMNNILYHWADTPETVTPAEALENVAMHGADALFGIRLRGLDGQRILIKQRLLFRLLSGHTPAGVDIVTIIPNPKSQIEPAYMGPEVETVEALQALLGSSPK